MKKLTFTLITALLAFFVNRYSPFFSRKLLWEYLLVIYLSFKFSKLKKVEEVVKTPFLETN
jgi:hypothetical protein